MKIEHVLRDGRKVKNIDGYVIKYDEFRSLYKFIAESSKRRRKYVNGDEDKGEAVGEK